MGRKRRLSDGYVLNQLALRNFFDKVIGIFHKNFNKVILCYNTPSEILSNLSTTTTYPWWSLVKGWCKVQLNLDSGWSLLFRDGRKHRVNCTSGGFQPFSFSITPNINCNAPPPPPIQLYPKEHYLTTSCVPQVVNLLLFTVTRANLNWDERLN